MNSIEYANNNEHSIEIKNNIKNRSNLRLKPVFFDVETISMLVLYSKYGHLLVNVVSNQLDKLYENTSIGIFKNIRTHLKNYENIILNNADLGLQSHFNIIEQLEIFNPDSVLILDSYTGILKSLIIKYSSLVKQVNIHFLDLSMDKNLKNVKYTNEIKTIFGYEFKLLNENNYNLTNTYDFETQNEIQKIFRENKDNKLEFVIFRYQPKNMYILNVVNFFSNVLLLIKILKTNGNAIIVIPRFSYLNKVTKQILYLLVQLFEKTQFCYTETTLMTDCYFLFKNYKSIDNVQLEILNEILKEINKINPNGGKDINFKNDYLRQKYGILEQFNDSSYDSVVYSLLKFNKKSTSFKKFMDQIEDIARSEKKQSNNYKNIMFKKLIFQSNEQVVKFVDDHMKNSLNYSINYCKKFGFPVNPKYLYDETSYEKKILDETLTMPRNIIMNLLDYETIIDKKYKYKINNKEYANKQINIVTQDNDILQTKLDTKNLKYDNNNVYEMPRFKQVLEKLNIYKIAIDARRGFDKYGKPVTNQKEASEDYRQITMFINLPRGIIYYIRNTYSVNVTRAFIKMYEILKEFDLIDFTKNKITTLHTCELPGHFINATNYYIKSNKPDTEFNWYANSLNPNEEKNKIKYNQEIFGDQYGFLSKYVNRWIFGKDNTGDITNLDNVKYFKDLLNYSVDLFTSDCGLQTQDIEGFSNQEENLSILNYCQCLISLETLNIGGHGVYKIFLPMGSSVSVSIIYLMTKYFKYVYFIKQFSGSYGSSEIYMVCKYKKYHLDNHVREYLYNCLLNYDKTKALFPQNFYDSKFLDQLIVISQEFVKKTVKTIKRSLYYYDNQEILKKHKQMINDAKQIYGKIWCRDVGFKVLDKSLML